MSKNQDSEEDTIDSQADRNEIERWPTLRVRSQFAKDD